MNIKYLRKLITSPLIWFIIAGLAIGSYAWMVEVSGISWAAIALTIALISIGIAFDSYLRTAKINEQMKEINSSLDQIKNSLEAIKNKQNEESSSGSMIIPTLETFTKFYLDYLDKQQGGAEKQINKSDTDDQKDKE
ncbi:MAG: hypothetical protein JSV74_02380 [Dehalococcoidia bacterium]|nr:MAG: hypothetical protein JSV74_02380 [Dehalococcoidia bacterium]